MALKLSGLLCKAALRRAMTRRVPGNPPAGCERLNPRLPHGAAAGCERLNANPRLPHGAAAGCERLNPTPRLPHGAVAGARPRNIVVAGACGWPRSLGTHGGASARRAGTGRAAHGARRAAGRLAASRSVGLAGFAPKVMRRTGTRASIPEAASWGCGAAKLSSPPVGDCRAAGLGLRRLHFFSDESEDASSAARLEEGS